MNIKLEIINESDLKKYKTDMQEAFRLGALEGGFPMDMCEEILPEKDIDASLAKQNSIAYKAVIDGETVGGAIITVNGRKRSGYLEFLYVKHGLQGRGIGKFIWFEIEKLHSEIELWETCTPYFERRNLHFYINVCGFHVTEYRNEHFKGSHSCFDDHETEGEKNGSDDGNGMFAFRKEIKFPSEKIKIPFSIDTERLVVRNFKEKDLEAYYRLVSEPRVNCFRDVEYEGIEDAREELCGKISCSDGTELAVALKNSDEFIGYLFGRWEERDTFSAGWNFLPEFCGKGYACESARAYFDLLFGKLKARRITAFTEDDNFPSHRLCERLGMRREGLFKELISFVCNEDGTPRYENTYTWAILKKEWEK